MCCQIKAAAFARFARLLLLTCFSRKASPIGESAAAPSSARLRFARANPTDPRTCRPASQLHSSRAAELMSERSSNSPPPFVRRPTHPFSSYHLPSADGHPHNGMHSTSCVTACRLRGARSAADMAAESLPAAGWAEIPHDVLERVFQTLPVRVPGRLKPQHDHKIHWEGQQLSACQAKTTSFQPCSLFCMTLMPTCSDCRMLQTRSARGRRAAAGGQPASSCGIRG